VTHGATVVHNTCNAKFLRLIIDTTLSWKDHINQLVIKLISVAYAIRTLSFVTSQASFFDDLLCLCSLCYVLQNYISVQFGP
jgi:hypothetical protein